jgi:hypothetical protein
MGRLYVIVFGFALGSTCLNSLGPCYYQQAAKTWNVASAAFQVFDLTRPWMLEVWELDDSDRPLAQMIPDVVPMKKLFACDAPFWGIGRKTSRSMPTVASSSSDAPPPPVLVAIEDIPLELLVADEGCGSDEENGCGEPESELGDLLGQAYAFHDLDISPHEDGEPIMRVRAEESMEVPGGKITFYRNKCDFEAVCSHHKEGGHRCVLTRQNTAYHASAKGTDSVPIGGRCLGLMAAWLARGCKCRQSDHKAEVGAISFEERFSKREDIAKLDGYSVLESCERQGLHDDELPFEPIHVSMPN